MMMRNDGWQATGIRCKCGILDSKGCDRRLVAQTEQICVTDNIFWEVLVSWQILLGKAQSRKYLLKVPIPEGKREPLFKADAITVLRGGQEAKAGIGEGKSRG